MAKVEGICKRKCIKYIFGSSNLRVFIHFDLFYREILEPLFVQLRLTVVLKYYFSKTMHLILINDSSTNALGVFWGVYLTRFTRSINSTKITAQILRSVYYSTEFPITQ